MQFDPSGISGIERRGRGFHAIREQLPISGRSMEAGHALRPGLLSSGAVAQKYVVTVVLVPLIAGKPDLTD
jgi:hypothetical protein